MPIPRDKVFIGAARPSTIWGTDSRAIIANTIVAMYAFMFTDNLWALAAWFPMHGVAWAITKYDPHAFRLLSLKISHLVETIGNRVYWRASTRNPFSKRNY